MTQKKQKTNKSWLRANHPQNEHRKSKALNGQESYNFQKQPTKNFT